MYFFNLAQVLGTGALAMGVSRPHNGLQMFLCVSETSKQNLVFGALIEAPHVFAQLGRGFVHWHSAYRCVNTSQMV